MNNLFETESTPVEKTFREKVSAALAPVIKLYKKVPRKPRIILTIVAITAFFLFLLIAFKPEAEKRPTPEVIVVVDVVEAQRRDYPVIVEANGTVEANTRGKLVSQIRGEIIKVSDQFNAGGSFTKGDVLVKIDDRDYKSELSRALAGLSQAQAQYSQEKATAKQAANDWKRLGNTSPAPALVLRKPQLAAAKAELDSAQANYETANLNLQRTEITAPYTGKVINREAVLGQYVSVSTPLAEIFATDIIQVRLPLSQSEFSQLGLDSLDTGKQNYKVSINSNIGSQTYSWQANVSRVDSVYDLSTRQIDVIATVSDPFSLNTKSAQPPLKIGQFVRAKIQGDLVKDALVIPNSAIREAHFVYVAEEGILRKRSVDIFWQDNNNALVSSGVNAGDLIITTAVNSSLVGAKVKFNSKKDDQSTKQQEQKAAPEKPEKPADNQASPKS